MVSVKQLHPLFVGEISGIDVSRPLSPSDHKAIVDAIDRYAVVVFHGQNLDDATQIAFASQFGPVESSAAKLRQRDIKHRLASNEIADISNLDSEGKVLQPEARRRLDWLGNRLWHTDASFRRVPGALSLLYAHIVPPEGGETEFADMRAAYDALPDRTKKELEGLVAEHSIWRSREQLGVVKYSEEELASLPPVPQRVVRTHPGSGRKTLYVASHASHILGRPVADGRLLLLDLIEHATQPRFVHSHTWKQGDLVIWDNRCTMHRARPFDTTQVRDLRRVTTRDVASTLEQAA